MTKITDKMRIDIRKMVDDGAMISKIAEKFKISTRSVLTISSEHKKNKIVNRNIEEINLKARNNDTIEVAIERLNSIIPTTKNAMCKAIKDLNELLNLIQITPDIDDTEIMRKVLIYDKIADAMEKWVLRVGGMKMTMEVVQSVNNENKPKFIIQPVKLIKDEPTNT